MVVVVVYSHHFATSGLSAWVGVSEVLTISSHLDPHAFLGELEHDDVIEDSDSGEDPHHGDSGPDEHEEVILVTLPHVLVPVVRAARVHVVVVVVLEVSHPVITSLHSSSSFVPHGFLSRLHHVSNGINHLVSEDGGHDEEDDGSEDHEDSCHGVDNGNTSSVVWIVEEGWDEEEGEPDGVSEESPGLALEAHLLVQHGGEEFSKTNHEGTNPEWDLAAAEGVVSEAHF